MTGKKRIELLAHLPGGTTEVRMILVPDHWDETSIMREAKSWAEKLGAISWSWDDAIERCISAAKAHAKAMSN